MSRLLNKVAIITGAASNPGLGHATAVRFAQEGAKLVITDIDLVGLAAAEKELVALGAEVLSMEQNVVDEGRWQEVIDAAVERFGGLDVLVNNAGIAVLKPINEYTQADYNMQMDVNLRSVFLGCQKAVPAMKDSGGGSIVNISSIYGYKPSDVGHSAYSASKHGVIGLSGSAAIDYAKDGIRVNTVCPGYCHSEMVDPAFEAQPELAKSVLNRHSATKRLGESDEAAEVMAWLCSDASSFVNGASLTVDGGTTARLY